MIKTCKQCKSEFNDILKNVDGKKYRHGRRKICFICKPIRPLQKDPIAICNLCGKSFSIKSNDQYSYNRKNCFVCKPFVIQRNNHVSNDTRECLKCKKIFPNTPKHFRKQGKYLSPKCNECNRNYQRNRSFEKKLIAFKIYGDNKCKICNYGFCPASLTFHHIDASQKDSQIKHTPLLRLESEIKKCMLVCNNCHMEIHNGRHPDILKVSNVNSPSNMYNRNYTLARKQERINYLGGKCIDCGYDKCSRALDFHHRDPKEKLFEISEHNTMSLEKIKSELDKCDLVCSNCHGERHDV